MVVSVVGGGGKFSDGEISKTTTVGPLQFNYAVLLPKAPVTILHGYTAFDNIPVPQWKASTTSHRRISADKRTNEQIYDPS